MRLRLRLLSSAALAGISTGAVGAESAAFSAKVLNYFDITLPGAKSSQCAIVANASFGKRVGVIAPQACAQTGGLKKAAAILLTRSTLNPVGKDEAGLAALEFFRDQVDGEAYVYTGTAGFKVSGVVTFTAKVDEVDEESIDLSHEENGKQIAKKVATCILRITVARPDRPEGLTVYYPKNECPANLNAYRGKTVAFDYSDAEYFGKGKASYQMIQALTSANYKFVIGYDGPLTIKN